MIRSRYLNILPVLMIGGVVNLVAGARADSDMFVTNVGGRVTIGGANDLETIDENFDLTTQVFRREMLPFPPATDPHDFRHNDPGFFALPSGSSEFPAGASALPPNAPVTIHFPTFTVGANTDSLFYWDGSGAVNFQPVSTVQPGAAITLAPNPVGTTSATGFLHQHPSFALSKGGPTPLDGVYLDAPTVSVTGLPDAKRFFMVWVIDSLIPDQDTADALEEALDSDNPPIVNGKDFSYVNHAVGYVQSNLVVPEPGGLALIASACGSLVTMVGVRRARSR